MNRRVEKIVGHLSQDGPDFRAIVLEETSSQSFRYTDDTTSEGLLSLEQRKFYEENGYLLFRKLLTKDEVKVYEDRFVDICNGAKYDKDITVMKDIALDKKMSKFGDQRRVTKIQQWHNDDQLMKYPKNPKIKKLVTAICGNNFCTVDTLLINKPRDAGKKTSRHPLHQDLWYYPFRPANRVVGTWTAMQRVNRQNGCLSIIPGTHKLGLVRHSYPDWHGGVNYLYHGVDNFHELDVEHNLVHVEMEPGDTILFHPCLIHGSGRNRTDGLRKGITVHFADTSCHYFNPENTIQDHLWHEIQARVKKYGGDLSYIDIVNVWPRRCKVIQGKAGTMQERLSDS